MVDVKVPKMTVVKITSISVELTSTSLTSSPSSVSSWILMTKPNAMAPLIRAAYEMNVSSLQLR